MPDARDYLIGFEALFSSMSPDSAVVFLMFTVLLKKMVDKGIFTKEEVYDLSIRAGELLGEITTYFKE